MPAQGARLLLDDGDCLAIRAGNWKVVFMEQRAPGTLQIWAEPFVVLRLPKLYNLRTDPFEHADITSNTYFDWMIRRGFLIFYANAIAAHFLETFREFPPRQRPASFSIDQAVEKLNALVAGG